jgi:hypothetical protein
VKQKALGLECSTSAWSAMSSSGHRVTSGLAGSAPSVAFLKPQYRVFTCVRMYVLQAPAISVYTSCIWL